MPSTHAVTASIATERAHSVGAMHYTCLHERHRPIAALERLRVVGALGHKWQAQLRRQQAWWREKRLGLPAGPRVGHSRLVSSMLPDDVNLSTNLMWPEAVDAAEKALIALATENRPGLIHEERLRRNLLSSQPLCFNLFG